MKRLLAILLLCNTLLAAPLYAAINNDPKLHWRTLDTAHFEIHFHDGEAALAQRVAALAEQIHDKLTAPLNWQPTARTQLVLTDRFDYANGSATPFPRNQMNIIVTPPRSDSSINDYNDWLNTLLTHEYTHILHLDKNRGLPHGLQGLFGRLPLLFPNILQPPWFIEGLATYYETDRSNYLGRGQSTWFRMLMRMEVEHGIKSIHQVNQPLESWPMNTVRYLYGVYFYQFVAARYGDDKVRELVEQYSDNLIPFMINSNSRKVLGTKLNKLWDEFAEYLHDDFGAEITRIRAQGESPLQQLTNYGYFTGIARMAGNGDIYFQRNDTQSEPRLMRMRPGEATQAVGDMRSRYFDLHPTAGVLFSERDATHSTNIFSALYRMDPHNGKRTQLTHGARYLYAAWSPDGQQIIAVHNSGGESALHLLDTNGKLLDILWRGRAQEVLGALDWSPDGRQLVMPVWRRDSLWNIELFTLKDRQWKMLTRRSGIETTPRFSRDGQSVLFSADYGGVYNIQRLDLGSGELHTLSNLVGGAFGPLEAAGGELYFTGLNERGFDLYRLPAAKPRPVAAPGPATPAFTPPEPPAAALPVRDYSALRRITPTSWLPYLSLVDDRSEIGLSTSGNDPLQRHNYDLLFAYDTRNDWLIGAASYVYDRWNPTLKFTFNRDVFSLRDLNGAAVHFINSDSLTGEALWPFFRYARRWMLHLGLVANIETDKLVHDGFAPLGTTRDTLLGAAVSFDSRRRYSRSISPSNGRQLRLIAEDNDLLNSDSSGQTYILDWREFIDLPGKQVLATRLVAGWGTDNPRPFRLGGSISSRVPTDPQAAALAPTDTLFNRRRYALRGYSEGLAGLTNRRMGLVEAEWRFPIGLLERGFMAPPIGIHQLHGRLFVNGGDAWYERLGVNHLKWGVGGEIITELVLGYWLPVQLRLGYAKGVSDYGQEQIYLDMGGSF